MRNNKKIKRKDDIRKFFKTKRKNRKRTDREKDIDSDLEVE